MRVMRPAIGGGRAVMQIKHVPKSVYKLSRHAISQTIIKDNFRFSSGSSKISLVCKIGI